MNGPTAKSYPTERQYQAWKDHADQMDMTISEFNGSMVEAGREKFTVEVEPDESRLELREQRNDLQRELQRTRERVRTLEGRLTQTEHRTIVQYVGSNPGCTWDEIVQHLANTVPQRALNHLDAMEGETLRRDDEDGFYLVGENQ